MLSPLSRPVSAASTRVSVDITVSGFKVDSGIPELSQISVAVEAGSTT
jgi:hypothetical protein